MNIGAQNYPVLQTSCLKCNQNHKVIDYTAFWKFNSAARLMHGKLLGQSWKWQFEQWHLQVCAICLYLCKEHFELKNRDFFFITFLIISQNIHLTDAYTRQSFYTLEIIQHINELSCTQGCLYVCLIKCALEW